MKHITSNAKQDGISLIEVIISMFLLTTLVVFYASALNLVAVTRKLRNENLAYHIAQKQMEGLRSTPYASLPSSGTISDSLLNQIPSGSGIYSVSDYPAHSGVKEIVVTISWNDGLAKSVVLQTLAGTGGINP